VGAVRLGGGGDGVWEVGVGQDADTNRPIQNAGGGKIPEERVRRTRKHVKSRHHGRVDNGTQKSTITNKLRNQKGTIKKKRQKGLDTQKEKKNILIQE